MSTPRVRVSPRVSPGWRANDLTPDDIAHLLDRFITKFEPGAPDECWPWLAGRLPNGYGLLRRSNQPALLAHRVSWVAFTGRELTDQLTIDHLCFNKLCVDPGHLEPVPLRENLRRAMERRGFAYTSGGSRAARDARAATPTACELCGKAMQRGHLRRHARRFHADEVAV